MSFILSTKPHHQKLVQRLDGIYFNSAQDWKALNEPIRRTFEISSGVIYQSNFNKDLTEALINLKQFGLALLLGGLIKDSKKMLDIF